MTVDLKTLRAELRTILSAVSCGENFRTTGDCSIHNHHDIRREEA